MLERNPRLPFPRARKSRRAASYRDMRFGDLNGYGLSFLSATYAEFHGQAFLALFMNNTASANLQHS